MPKNAHIFTEESCKPNRWIPLNVKLLGPYKSNVWAILGPCFDYFYNIFASRCLKWLKFLLKNYAYQIEENYLMFNCLGHIGTMFEPYLSYFFNIFACRCLKWLKFSLKCHVYQIEEYFDVTLFGPYWSHLGNIRALFWLFLQFI